MPLAMAVGPLHVIVGEPIAVVLRDRLPSAAPLHVVGLGVSDAVGVGPALMVAVAVAEQPAPAVTVTV